ncbi:MAG TPA: 6,7-dimethyl-8-ribityllumazine synthase [Ilumatobacter sp.]|nr:6,7-dimethyl-8-ribityllumazine synthase [Ilumatobacter sp.]
MTTFHGHPDGTGRRFAIICSRFNDLIVSRLEAGARDTLQRHGVGDDDIDTMWVPGAWEIPIAAKVTAETGRYDAVIALGAVMRGATYHFEIVANHSAAGLARVALDTGVVVTNGIITVDTMDQALERAGSKAGNKGTDAALAALETVHLLAQLAAR